MWKLLLAGVVMMGSVQGANISHEKRESSKEKLVQKVKERGDLPYGTVGRQLEILDQLSEFELGKFLIERGGINGYWTHYVVTYPEEKRAEVTPFEQLILEKMPVVLATQERFQIFKREMQKRVKEGCTMASIPSGLMGDLLSLDFSEVGQFSLVGIDLDEESLVQAAVLAEEKKLVHHCQFLQEDAWSFGEEGDFDLISSNGLNIYEPSEERVIALYEQFHRALKPGGVLVTSFLTPPTEWEMSKVNAQDAAMQKLIFFDILESRWQAFLPEEVAKEQLKRAGFVDIEVIYDKAHLFPTLVAKKG